MGSLTMPAPTACASCVFGAYSSKILSFTSSYIEHITVSVTPHITVYTNGSRSTSFESNTLTKSAVVGGIAGSNSSKTYSRKSDITWTVGGATLTYPTKYVQYLGFSGGPAATADGDTCAESTDASVISLPQTTEAASFIYALPANATALALPTPLLQYLGGLDDLVEQFYGAALTGCAPLDGGAEHDGHGSIPHTVSRNDSAASASGYAGPSGGLVSQSSLRDTDFISQSSSGTVISPQLSTGYGVPETGVASLPGLSTSFSSSTFLSQSYTASSSEVSTSRLRFSILPHPYLNTTSSESSGTTETTSCAIPVSTSAFATTSFSESVSLPESYGVSTPSTATLTLSGTGDAGELPTPSTSRTTSYVVDLPPKGPQPGPEGTPPDGDDGGDDGINGSSTLAASTTESQIITQPAYQTPEASSPSSNGEGENVHTTAFVIEPITGSALITYESMPTRTNDDGKPPGYTGGGENSGGGGGGGGGNGGNGAEDGEDVAKPTQTDEPDLGGLLGQVGTGASGEQNSADDSSGNSGSAPGYDDAPDSSSPAQQPSDQHQPGVNAGSSSHKGSEQASDGEGGSGRAAAQGQGLDLGHLTSLIVSAAHATRPGSVYSAGNTVVTAQPGGAVVIGEQTITPGQSFTIGSGPSATIVAIETGNGEKDLVVGGSTYQALPGSTVQVLPGEGTITSAPTAVTGISSMALITTNGQTITAIQSGSSLILQAGSSTTMVAVGKAATFAGETILAVPTEDAVFVNGNITPMTAAEGVDGASQAVITADGHTITALDAGNSVLLVEGSTTKTLQDGSDVVFQGQTISAQESAMAVVVNGHTSSLTSAIALATGQAVVTADGQTFSALDLPGYVVLHDGTTSLTIRDGATATFEGQTITALSNGDAIAVDGHTVSMTSPVNLATAQAIITAGGYTFTALDMDDYIILKDGTSTLTIKDGKTAIFDGQTIRALSSGEAVLVNGRTMSLTSVEASATPQINEYINKGLSGGSTSAQTVGTASSEPTDGSEPNAARALVTRWSVLAIACLSSSVVLL